MGDRFGLSVAVILVRARRNLVLKACRNLIEHVAGFAAIEATVIVLIEPICGDQSKAQHDDTAHRNSASFAIKEPHAQF
jgi:hypothetical protein